MNQTYQDNFQKGLEFQDYVIDKLSEIGLTVQTYSSRKYQYEKGESRQGIEIKLDSRCTETGRLSIEVAEKTSADKGEWTPSGVMRDDNTWLYVQGNYDRLYVFPKKYLKAVVSKLPTAESFGTVRKAYLGADQAERIAAIVLDFQQ